MKKIGMMTAMMVGCLCVGAAMAESEQKEPGSKGPRMERREKRDGEGKRPEMDATRFGGKVVAKDGAKVTVKNLRAEKEMTFTAKSDKAKTMLEGVAVGDFVGIRWEKSEGGPVLVAIHKRGAPPEGAPGEARMRKGEGPKDKPAVEGQGKGEGKQEGKDKRPEMDGDHFGGKVVAKDGPKVTVKNPRAEKEMTFTAKSDKAKEMLEGVAVGDFVGVRWAKSEEGPVLEGIRKFDGPPREGAPGEARMRKGEGPKDKPAVEGQGKGEGKAEGCCEGCKKDKAD